MINIKCNRNAFTMIELVFAIVVIGILASLAMPRIERDLISEASTNILSDIRYTQHMALMENKQQAMRANANRWQQRWWKIMFDTCTQANNTRFYMIGSDDNANGNGVFARNEAANDPTNGLPMFWTNGTNCDNGGDGTVSDRIFITDKYGITNVTFKDVAPIGRGRSCTGASHIGFDYLGRPHQGFGASTIPDYRSYLSQDCDITFTMSTDADGDGANDTFTIRITAETGYAFILNQPNS